MASKTTFATLEKHLLSLGFRESTRAGHVVFMHESGRPTIILPRYGRREIVNPVHLLSVRKTLQDVGLFEPEDFNITA